MVETWTISPSGTTYIKKNNHDGSFEFKPAAAGKNFEIKCTKNENGVTKVGTTTYTPPGCMAAGLSGINTVDFTVNDWNDGGELIGSTGEITITGTSQDSSGNYERPHITFAYSDDDEGTPVEGWEITHWNEIIDEFAFTATCKYIGIYPAKTNFTANVVQPSSGYVVEVQGIKINKLGVKIYWEVRDVKGHVPPSFTGATGNTSALTVVGTCKYEDNTGGSVTAMVSEDVNFSLNLGPNISGDSFDCRCAGTPTLKPESCIANVTISAGTYTGTTSKTANSIEYSCDTGQQSIICHYENAFYRGLPAIGFSPSGKTETDNFTITYVKGWS